MHTPSPSLMNNDSNPRPRTMSDLARLYDWGVKPPSMTQDQYWVGQHPGKAWTPGREDFELLAEMFRTRSPRAGRKR